ncbi:hypothetical protein [Parvularcula sp. IMCC14364]|uniref:hypothetical protein n=1 Tax=Parvularcula sp. IMCC14364 TaxID=3067902 RepID=UPI002740E2BB|nr:hypothetical protein [Parvularcula sp. IMCC14364]
MSILQILAASAAVLFIIFTSVIAARADKGGATSWMIPACLSFVFFMYSALTVFQEGPLGFWTEHISDMWGNQIWFDLLLAIGVSFFLLAPRAKAVGMRLFPWLIFIICTGCIGLLAMLARFLYLKEREQTSP